MFFQAFETGFLLYLPTGNPNLPTGKQRFQILFAPPIFVASKALNAKRITHRKKPQCKFHQQKNLQP